METPPTITKKELVCGTGSPPLTGSFVTVHYRGRLASTPSSFFDDSYARGKPLIVNHGKDQVSIFLTWFPF